MGEPKHSPVPKLEVAPAEPAKNLDFAEAIKKIMQGRRVTSEAWEDPDTYGYVNNGYLMLHKSETGKDHKWIVNDGDMSATDWIVV